MLLLFYNIVLSQSDDVIFNHITTENGISHNNVYAICQDNNGFMWFGTQNGLNIYNGKDFFYYFHDILDSNSISSNNFGKIHVDRSGKIWFGTYGGGLDMYNPQNNTIKHFKNEQGNSKSLCNNFILCIFEDKQGVLWFGTANGGFCKFDPINECFINYSYQLNNQFSLSNNNVRAICEDNKGYLWIGTSDGLNRMNKETGRFKKYFPDKSNSNSINSKQIQSLCFVEPNKIWIGTRNNGINILNIETEQFISYKNDPDNPKSISDNRVDNIFKDSYGTIWIGTYNGGLNKFDNKTKTFINYKHYSNNTFSISHNRIEFIFEDKSNNLWIATRGGGINKLDLKPRKFTNYYYEQNNPNSIPYPIITSIASENKDVLWIATDGGGLCRFDKNKNIFFNLKHEDENKNSLSNNRVRAVVVDKSGIIWIGTYRGGLDKLIWKNNTNYKYIHYKYKANDTNSLNSNQVNVVYIDNNEDLWIGTINGICKLVYSKDSSKISFKRYTHNSKDPLSLSHHYVTSIFHDHLGQLWIGTFDGLNKFNPETEKFQHYKNIPGDSNSINSNHILTIFEDHAGFLWIGTEDNGINKFNQKTQSFTGYKDENIRSNNMITGILEDEKNNLWISKANGISKFNPVTQKFKNYDVTDGLVGNGYNRNACLKTESGEMFFGSIAGLTSFFPSKIKDNPNIPPVVLVDFKILNKSIYKHQNSFNVKCPYNIKQIKLSHKDYVFSFEFAALDYTKFEKNLYEYKMEGFDDKWINIGNRRFVSYTNLPPGNYIFKVKASNNDKVWNEKGLSVNILVKPPFWKTKGFYALEILFTIFLVYSIIMYRIRKLQRDKKILEDKVTERTKEVELQKEEIIRQRDEITDSIFYAKHIQTAVSPSKEFIDNILDDYFILDLAKGIVSGDFYWISENDEKIIVAVADCTGHGVPGAFMSMMGILFLNKIVNEENIIKPNEILDSLKNNVISSLHQNGNTRETSDGMDISLITIDKQNNFLEYTGANNSIYLIRNNEFTEIYPDKMPIGIYHETDKKFSYQKIEIQSGDMIYLYTDGYIDQFGGEKEKKYMFNKFREILLSIHNYPLEYQKEKLETEHKEWKKNNEQVDDILIMGIKI